MASSAWSQSVAEAGRIYSEQTARDLRRARVSRNVRRGTGPLSAEALPTRVSTSAGTGSTGCTSNCGSSSGTTESRYNTGSQLEGRNRSAASEYTPSEQTAPPPDPPDLSKHPGDSSFEWGTAFDRTGVFINIHADPVAPDFSNQGRLEPIDAEEAFNKLYELANWAAAYNHRLTIMLSPRWTTYLLDESTAGYSIGFGAPVRAKLADLLFQGHVLGFHHHDVSHSGGAGWDGYHSIGTSGCMSWGHSLAECVSFPDFGLGIAPTNAVSHAFEDFKDLVSSLIADYGVPSSEYGSGYAANHGTTDAYRDDEWQSEAVFSQDSNSIGQLLSQPYCKTYGGHTVSEIGSSPFAVGVINMKSAQVTTSNIISALRRAAPSYYAGVTFHAWEFRDDLDTNHYDPVRDVNDDDRIIELFSQLDASGFNAVPMQDILLSEVAELGLSC